MQSWKCPNWILQHPAYLKMKNLEVEDAEQIHAAFLVYMNLTEVRHWKEVSCLKSEPLKLVLLEGKEKEGSATYSVLPLPAHRSLSHKNIRDVLERGFPMLLCAVAADSTLVYQRLSDGLVTPDPPAGPFLDVDRRQRRKRRQRRQAALNSD
ncbi:tRNA-splicing endonuclease subunit Sen15 [Corythoichthys intestinalis]|uniref:tRNA-splicing endonuclease subunit Sen15 n=1 Tax=Corythoichthys intestinalis TaxID=161448 RepID=UPI0025A5FE65|nr:tRNA-splicing endonuclease subunit Sen15 [Corythoichthys intestinalis]XP_061794915.1 tRNA-splicing endonuclease subunit Sen15-like [Nerophis lumbriciformis]